jgi:hypothetical protein
VGENAISRRGKAGKDRDKSWNDAKRFPTGPLKPQGVRGVLFGEELAAGSNPAFSNNKERDLEDHGQDQGSAPEI